MDELLAAIRPLIEDLFTGQDVVEAINRPDALAEMHRVLDPIAVEGFVTEMVADAGFRAEQTGVEGFYEAWHDWSAPFRTLRIEVDELQQSGDKLLTIVNQTGLPKGGDIEIVSRSAAVWTVAGGKLARVEFHLDVDVARKAAESG